VSYGEIALPAARETGSVKVLLSPTTYRRLPLAFEALVSTLADAGRDTKRQLSMSMDALFSVLALWLAYSLRLGVPFADFAPTWHYFVVLPVVTVTVFGSLGVYRWVIRSSNREIARLLLAGSAVSAVLLVLGTFLFPASIVNPRSLFLLYGTCLAVLAIGTRFVWQDLVGDAVRGEPVAIYGAGNAGRQLVHLLQSDPAFRPVVFIDDDPAIVGQTIAGLPVIDGGDEDLVKRLAQRDTSRVILALPTISSAAHRAKISRLGTAGLAIKTMPGINELLAGTSRPDEIRDVSFADLLGRREVTPDPRRLGLRVTGRSVLVTGGGGSIGSELCRQIAQLSPDRLVILEHGEENLYTITEELEPKARGRFEFVPQLGSVCDGPLLARLIARYEVSTVFHAAAYKHVPIVEAQPEQGVLTNVFGTRTLIEKAVAGRVDDVVLISTDKAVRPANAMGASKRVAEMLVQASAFEQDDTRVSIVRFGNVLGSSGSVVPKFKAQILGGGPVTLTHRDITRFFMTITEASQLVLQASTVARGGEVFVLDMGEPIRIEDLAIGMIGLLGKRLASDTGNPDDIEIVAEGLRPGEKMYEELFITDEHRSTGIPKVFVANEQFLPWQTLQRVLLDLEREVGCGNSDAVRTILMDLAYGRILPDVAADARDPVRSQDNRRGAARSGEKRRACVKPQLVADSLA